MSSLPDNGRACKQLIAQSMGYETNISPLIQISSNI